MDGTIQAGDIPDLSGTYATAGSVNPSFVNWTTGASVGGFTGSLMINNVYYIKIGKMVHLWYQFQGTSNDSTLSFTLPFAADSSLSSHDFASKIKDNGSSISTPGNASFPYSTNLVYIFKDFGGTSWTASGTKAADGYICYEATT